MGVCVVHPRRVASQTAMYCICVGIIAYDESHGITGMDVLCK